MSLPEHRALVLNQNYEPLNVCTPRRAVVLVGSGKAESLVPSGRVLRTVDRAYEAPSVIRLQQMVRRPRPRLRLTRHEVFRRDQHRCQYCDRSGGDLTIDHVMPRRLGGEHRWENVVAACRPCNHRKGGRTPQQARMTLRQPPHRPVATVAVLFGQYLPHHGDWVPFLRGWIRDDDPVLAAAS